MSEKQGKANDTAKENEQEKNPWSHTICLPQTEFPMRGNLPQREPEIQKFWEENKVYKKILESRRKSGAPVFLLHDGPPYANGNFHTGHALNKILKDTINKYHTLQGKYVPYIPGWDCHGLPIELAVQKKLANKKDSSDKDPIIIRRESRAYATNFIKIQAKDQSRFGVFWDNSEVETLTPENQFNPSTFYYTMSPQYEASILKAFRDIYSKGHIYKGKKPVYWCPVTATAHAEAEIEYKEAVSPSIYVAFPASHKDLPQESFVVIWTTTPWTLPANLGVSFHPEFSYALYNTPAGHLLIAEGLEEKFFAATNLSFSAKESLSQEQISELTVQHPFLDRESKVLFGDHVTLEAGTGIVHTAPGHGMDDYKVGLDAGLEPYSPVDHYGRYTDEFPLMAGMKVKDANPKILELLQEKGRLIHSSEIRHQYPHSWRSHAPLIMRATPQWFFAMDGLRAEALREAGRTLWIPDWGENRFKAMIENRPDWCLSRQRHWGVPIPAFTCEKCGETHMSTHSLDHIISLVEQHGIEVWFDRAASELLPPGATCEKCGHNQFAKETDILDVWFDSGVSWYSVLKDRDDTPIPADVYLEGSDQHRGWFQSSLWPSLAIEGKAPFKRVITHGYILDEKGRAMSKSLGNGIEPNTDIIPKFGADILRLWVASEDYRTDNTIGMDKLSHLAESYRKIRNTFRYILGNLRDGKEVETLSSRDVTDKIDLYFLNELALLAEEITNAYEKYEFHMVYQKVLHFCTVTLSSQYFDIIRDRLYCDATPDASGSQTAEAARRRSSLSALKIISDALMVYLAPILSFTMEEIFQLTSNGKDSVFSQAWPNVSIWKNDSLAEEFESLWKLKDFANRQMEQLRKNDAIGSSTEAMVEISGQDLSTFSPDEIARAFVVSAVVRDSSLSPGILRVKKAEGEKCPRCWIHAPLTEKGLCPRCSSVVTI